MDFEAIWHSHKPFILRVAGGALAFLLVSIFIGSVETEARTLARENASDQGRLQDDLARLEGAEGLEKGRAEALSGELETKLLDALLWRPEQAYLLPANEASPALFYAGRVAQAATDVQERANRRGCVCPTAPEQLGLPAEVAEGRIEEGLARTDLIRRLVMTVIDSGTRKVERVEPLDVHYEAREGSDGFLRMMGVSVVFQGDAKLAAAVLSELQVEGSFVEVIGCSIQRSGRRPTDPLEVRIDVQALSMVDTAPEAASGGSGPRGGIRRPGGRRPVRRFGGR